MKLGRIWAVALRHLYMQVRDLGCVFDVTFWPILEVMLWGFTSAWLQQESSLGIGRSLTLIPLLGAAFWQMVVRANIETSKCILLEFWGCNLSNLLSSPLTLPEWFGSLMIVSGLRALIVGVVCAFVIGAFYSYNILQFGLWLLPITVLLLMSGWVLGFCAAALIIRWGQRAESFVWTIGWLYTPLCGIYYPVEVLPQFLQVISKALPMTYIFKAIHEFLATGTCSWTLLHWAFVLNVIYLAVMFAFFKYMYSCAKKQGLAHLEAE